MSRVPAKRWGQPVDLSGAVVFLASAASDYVSGTSVVSGYSIGFSLFRKDGVADEDCSVGGRSLMVGSWACRPEFEHD